VHPKVHPHHRPGAGVPSEGARSFAVPRGDVKTRMYTRSPGTVRDRTRSGVRHGHRFSHKGRQFGRFPKGRQFRHFPRGDKFGHFDTRYFGHVLFFSPYAYYPYYSGYGRQYYPSYPPESPPYYDSRYYYDSPYDAPAEPYESPDEEPPEDYQRLEEERAAEHTRAAESLGYIAEPFREGDYAEALARAEAQAQAQPNNPIIGFAYVQALFANAQYAEAGAVLRRSLAEVDMETQGVLFGQDLYPDLAALHKGIADLEQTAKRTPGAADLYLLMAYQLIAVGRYDEVPAALRNARSYANIQAVRLLEEVLERIRSVEASPEGY